MPTEAEIYDFQGVLEPALAAPLKAAGYTVSLLSDGESFKKIRPRLELVTLIQPAQKRPVLPAASTRGILGENRALVYGGQTKITAVAGLDIATHRAYLAKVRNFTATFITRFNGVTLTNHALMAFEPVGEGFSNKASDGYYTTDLLFNSPFSIQLDAIRALE